MIMIIFGLALLTAPFVLISLFSDKKIGFIYILFFSFLFQTILAVLTQSLGIFYYNVIIGAALLADIFLLLIYFKIRKKFNKNFSFNFNNIDWIIIIVAVISILTLYQVHYNYTGKINLAIDQTVSYHQVKNMEYVYPYFSDEWYAISLVKGAINNHSLPVKNILNNSFFLNLELFFHSFIAEIMLILGLNPLLHYTILSIFLNTLIIILAYLFLRINNISKTTSGICSLLMLYITCGANLPGLWNLMPFNLGVLFFLISICLMEFSNAKIVAVSIVLASFFYPPLIPFYFIGLLVFLFTKRNNEESLSKIIFKILLFLFFAAISFYVILMISPLADKINYIFSRIFFISFIAPLLPQFHFYKIIPLPAILLIIFGLYYIYKNKKWVLLSELILGFIFWTIYSFTAHRFFAEYERVAVFTSIIIVIISGFGLKGLEEYIKLRFQGKKDNILNFAKIIILFIFLFLVPFYTQRENWKKITYINPADGRDIFSKSPANNYLTQDDIRIFKDIKNKKFLSIPWKGTVIGIATENYPVLTKEGTISIGSNKILADFAIADCKGKKNLAKKMKLDYIYTPEVNCQDFEKLDESGEGFILYKVR